MEAKYLDCTLQIGQYLREERTSKELFQIKGGLKDTTTKCNVCPGSEKKNYQKELNWEN